MRSKLGKIRLYQGFGAGLILSLCLLTGSAHADDWDVGGSNIHNTRSADSENKIKASNVAKLKKKWEFVTHGDVSATPTVEGNKVYAVDWGGYLYSIERDKGTANWSHQISDYTGNTVFSVSRTSPTVVGDKVIIGDQGDVSSAGFPQGGGTPDAHGNPTSQGVTASVMAIDKQTGKLLWRTLVSDHPFSVITSSPVASDGVIYVGVSSLEENAGFVPGYPGFSWRGKVVALDAKTGKAVWKQPFVTIDDASYNQGYTGASVWGSTPVVDESRGQLYVSTGNNYSAPSGYTSPGGKAAPDGDHFDSVLALDLSSGKLNWAYRAWNGDTWDVASWIFGGQPSYTGGDTALGPDWDFGSGPNLFTTKHGGDSVGAGAKSGIYYSLDPETGSLNWKTQVGPGGTGGGIEWGSAVDGNRIYCAISNSDGQVTTATPQGQGLWSALDAKTGKALWSTLDPLGGHDFGMVTVANGVVFAGSAGNKPNSFTGYPGAPGGFFALDASNGKILWQYTSADDPAMGSVICGPSIVDGVVYWGSGYSHLANAFGISGTTPKLYAFSLKDDDDNDH
ncbi:MAG TPA: PQQ-binding-like beta-propeller repeat protein [Chthonomonadaceae bacterium]|nr:PQQ-binding-like beta-propeller repeat protein [Chthonomonadaceae bacterium]